MQIILLRIIEKSINYASKSLVNENDMNWFDSYDDLSQFSQFETYYFQIIEIYFYYLFLNGKTTVKVNTFT